MKILTDASVELKNVHCICACRCQETDCTTDYCPFKFMLTHWGRVTHICVGNLTIIGSDNGLSPGRRQAITWTNVGILLIGPLGTNFSEILIEIHTFSFKKIHLKMSSGKWRPFRLGLIVLTYLPLWTKWPPFRRWQFQLNFLEWKY